MGISDYDATPGNNSTVGSGGPNVAEGSMVIKDTNNAIRQIMADQVDLELAQEVDVASSSTTDILGTASSRVRITGTSTITSFGTGTHKIRIVQFADELTLTHNATSLILPGGANITTAAGDTCTVVSDDSSNARVYHYQRASGGGVGESRYTLGSFQDFTSSGTWTRPTGCRAVIIEVVGGGGGGGNVASTSSGQAAAGGGGGAGGYAWKFLEGPAATSTITIGSAGAAESAGGTSSYADGTTTVSATGGGAGSTGAATANHIGVDAGANGTGSGGDVNAGGAPPSVGQTFPPRAKGGAGGSSPFGDGGAETVAGSSDATSGDVGKGRGAGGGGAASGASQSGRSAGAGTAGYVRILEFF